MKTRWAEEDSGAGTFPVVGIGASAGGLNALNCFIGTLSKDFGFAVVFFQHLSPAHKSLLPELLHNRRPDIHICEVSEGMTVKPGSIFLCPAGKDVGIREGIFRVTPLSKDHVHLPIDEFFTSLAEEAGARAIGAIFSGAGTDGARGIQAIRAAGGTVFVQDPETADFPSMPLAAIGTGRADAVLPPEEIALEIEKLVGVVPAAEKEITPAQFESFSRLLYEKTGHSFSHYKKSVVSRRIRRRMYLRGIASVHEYIKMAAEKDSEAASLAADLMIGVTSFFRDRLAWKALKIDVMRKLTAAGEDQAVRVWTPACATGEEAYSIAMMLRQELDLAGRKREIQVFATDVNAAALERAREGKYPGSISADVQPEYMKKFFSCSEDGLSVVVSKEIRESVVFAKQDLLVDPPFSRLDLIICRNLLIYLEPEAQEKCIAIFHYALKDGGYLFLGNAETPGRKSQLFKSLNHKKCRIYQKIKTKAPARLSLAVPFAPERSAAPPLRASAEYQQSLTEFVQQALLDESGPAAIAVTQHFEIVYNNGPTNRYLRQPRGTPTQNLLELLPENLRSRIRGALYRAAQEAGPVSIRAVIPADDERKRQTTLRISKLRDNLFLVIFRERGLAVKKADYATADTAAVDENAVRQLESELSATRADLQNHIEQLKSLNEELQSSNEELQAANEELETSREELQSLNEELITVNSQLQSKIEEQEATNNDLNNFLTSTNIPTVFLDHHFRVKRFTPAMSRLIKLIPTDTGRPISDLSGENLGPDLIADAESVLEHLVPIKKEIAIDGSWYVRTALPYRTSDNRIEGVVITYGDVSDLKRAEEQTRRLASFPRMNPNPVIEVDSSGRITFANPATEKILEILGADKGDVNAFLPPDMQEILEKLRMREESVLHREVAVKDKIFGEAVHVAAQFKVIRIYAYEITDIKKAEQIKGRLAAIVESADDAIISKDLKGTVTTWNIGAEKIFGYTAGEAVGKHISFLAAPGHEDETTGILRRIAKGEHIEHFETKRRRKDGQIIPVSLIFSPIRDESGKIVGASKIARDITERRKAEEALVRAKEQWERTFASVPDMIAIIDTNHRVVRVNESMARRLGCRPEECIGKKCYEAIHGTTAPPAFCPHTRTLKNGSEHVQEVHEERLGMDLLVTTTPLLDERGTMIGSVHVAHDITEGKQAEKALRESEEQFRTLADSMPNLAWWANSDGYITWYNRRWYDYTGATPEQMEGWGWQMAHDPDVLPAVMERWKMSLATGEPFDMEFPLRGADGVFRPFLTRVVPLRDSNGKVLRWFGTSTDVSEQKRTLEELRLSEEKFAAAFVGNPVAIVLSRLEDGMLLEMNDTWVAMSGYSRDEAVGHLTKDLHIWPSVENRTFFVEELKKNGTIRGWEQELKRKSGSPFVTQLSASVISVRGEKVVLTTLVDVTKSKQAEIELLRLTKVLKALSDSSQAVIRAKDEQEYLNDVCRIIIEDCGYSMVWIGFAENDEAKSVRPVAYHGFEEGYLETLHLTWADTELGCGPTGTAIRTGKVAMCKNVLTDNAFAPWRDEARRRGYASSSVFPLHIDDGLPGAITIYSGEPDPFSEKEVNFLTELADNMSYGIKVLRIRAAQRLAEDSLKKSLGRFELLTLTAGELLQSTEPQEVVESVCRKVMEYLDCNAFFNFLVDEEAGRLRLNACAGIPEVEAKRIEWLDFGVAVCGCAARDAQRIIAEHIPATPDERTELVKSYGIKAYCCHPLLGPGAKVIGTLSFGTCGRETFSEDDISLMKAVTDQVAVAIMRMRNEADVLKLGEDMAEQNIELESVNKELESFIYSISHDLRAPLRSMGGFAKIMVEDYAGSLDEQGKDYLRRIRNGSEKMTHLIDDLLDLSRISRQEIQRAEIDMSALARSVVSELREADPGRSVEVAIADGLFVFADRRLMEIVLSNILGNAWKFTSKTKNAKIEFGAVKEEEIGRMSSIRPISSAAHVFFVKDNGAGFDPKYIGKMFWPFQRLHTEREFPGTGIGLTIVDRIIHRHGGTVWAEGEVGKGATVYFTLR